MTITLAIDSATDVASVAVGDGNRIAAETQVPGRRHAEALLPAIEEVLARSGAGLADVRRVLCADGPGSFTGLRIGFATAQGLVRGVDGASAGTLPSLLAAAWTGGAGRDGSVAAVYDALRGDVYAAVYRFTSGIVETVAAPATVPLAALADWVGERPTIVVADPAVVPDAVARAWTGRPAVAIPEGVRAAALIALDGAAGGIREIDDLVSFEPAYGRPAEAQVRWEQAHGRRLPDSGGAFR